MQTIPFSNVRPGRGLSFRMALAVFATVWSATGLTAAICPDSEVDLRGKSIRFLPQTSTGPLHTSGSYEIYFAPAGNTYSIAAGGGFPAAVGKWDIEPRGGYSFVRLSDFPLSDGSHVLVSCTLNCLSGSIYEVAVGGGQGVGGLEKGQIEGGSGVVPAIEGAPSAAVNPTTPTVLAGSAVTFTATGGGAAPLAYQWYWADSLKIEGATNGTFTITNAIASNAGTYSVRVSNANGSAWSPAATLTVNSPPTVEKPSDQYAFTGQDVTFATSVSGTPPLSFQWIYTDPVFTNTTVLTNATSQFLTLTNLSIVNNGQYALIVSNAFGVTTSSNATLVVYNRPHPALSFGAYSSPAVTPGSGDVSVPVYYAANGSETNLSFSFSFDPAVLTNATFNPLIYNETQTICVCSVISNGPGEVAPITTNGPTRAAARPTALVANTQVFEDRSQISTGRLGIKIVLPAGVAFSPDYSNHIGVLSFNRVPGAANPFAGRVEFENAPTALQFLPDLSGDTTPFIHPIVPGFVAGDLTFNRQSGLVEQTIDITNPGDFAENVRVQVYGLGLDSRTNAVRLNNAIGSTVIGTNVVPVADLGAFGPGETRRAVLEYYVSDRRPQSVTPSIELRVVPAAVVTPSGTQLNIHNYRFTNGVFLVEFPTRSGYRYYVQYAATVTGTNQPSFKTSLPPVIGTGNYVQWLDNGPPKTDTLPTNGMRLYRLIETR